VQPTIFIDRPVNKSISVHRAKAVPIIEMAL
jgi:hypothetical protein